MSFKPIGSLFGSPSRRPKSGAIMALRVRQIAKETIERDFFDLPQELVGLVRVRVFKNGVLVISAPPLVAGELKMRSGGLREEINRRLSGPIVRQIKFKG